MSNFFDRISPAGSLLASLDQSAMRTRMIADRVAKASMGQDGGFQLPAPGAPGSPEAGGVDVEAEMTSLADEELRYETASKVLTSTYTNIRAAMRST